MSKTLEKLITKAEKEGSAVLNGRMSLGYGMKGALREKYAIERYGNKLELRHWGTTTLIVDLKKRKIEYFYGESASDRDSMNYILGRFNIEGGHRRFRYRPSIDEFSLVD